MRLKIINRTIYFAAFAFLLSACDGKAKSIDELKKDPSEAERILKGCGNPDKEEVNNCNNAREALAQINAENSLERLKK